MIFELWAIVSSHRNYAISSSGRVRNLHTGKLLKHQSSDRGGNYPFVNLYSDGLRKNVNVHILVAHAFLREPDRMENKTMIDHIDGNRKNVNWMNLEYVTPKENAIRRERRKCGN